ncbi:MAG: hypothetical protein R3E18_13180 [Sphingomonadaceae bacterium]|nr:hypothetical protein [Sphingomonadaceae bacterium]
MSERFVLLLEAWPVIAFIAVIGAIIYFLGRLFSGERLAKKHADEYAAREKLYEYLMALKAKLLSLGRRNRRLTYQPPVDPSPDE